MTAGDKKKSVSFLLFFVTRSTKEAAGIGGFSSNDKCRRGHNHEAMVRYCVTCSTGEKRFNRNAKNNGIIEIFNNERVLSSR